jgi:7-cyano-7-deazaguanine synthase
MTNPMPPNPAVEPPDSPAGGAAKRAVVLVSGGLDSATALALAVAQGWRCYALSFRYGQRHHHELKAAERVAAELGAADHRVVELNVGWIGGSALTDPLVEVPKDRGAEAIGAHDAAIPVTYVPARNTLFLSFALAWAEVLEAQAIVIGVNMLDSSGYPDCRPEFIAAFQTVAERATRAGTLGRAPRLWTPLAAWSKAQIIQQGLALGVDFALTTSCYDPAPEGGACGRCDSCHLRRRGFLRAGVEDPTRYSPAALY